jgi:glycosyltransferase involved in cell wall biosynthesis
MPIDVSIIIPTHNREAYLVEAIDSALAQTYPNTEIIVVDDGSTDGTRARVSAYGDRIKYVFTANGGVAHARNVGMSVATGRYLTFLDSDDLLYPYAVELEAAVLDRYPDVGMVYAEMSGFDDTGFFERYHLKTYHSSAYRDPRLTYSRIFNESAAAADAVAIPPLALQDDPAASSRRVYLGRIFDTYLTSIIVFQNSLMMRRSLISQIGDRNVRVRHWQELDYAMRMCRAGKVAFVDIPTYKLRYHAGQISSTSGDDGKTVWVRKQRILLRVIKRHALSDRTYYQQHQARLDRHLAHLHRAVAVPLMLSDPQSRTFSGYGRRARAYLRRCARYGYPERRLWILTYAPRSVRRFGVSVIEQIRKVRSRWAARRRVFAS